MAYKQENNSLTLEMQIKSQYYTIFQLQISKALKIWDSKLGKDDKLAPHFWQGYKLEQSFWK